MCPYSMILWDCGPLTIVPRCGGAWQVVVMQQVKDGGLTIGDAVTQVKHAAARCCGGAVLWLCCGCDMAVLWLCCGCDMAVLWLDCDAGTCMRQSGS